MLNLAHPWSWKMIIKIVHGSWCKQSWPINDHVPLIIMYHYHPITIIVDQQQISTKAAQRCSPWIPVVWHSSKSPTWDRWIMNDGGSMMVDNGVSMMVQWWLIMMIDNDVNNGSMMVFIIVNMVHDHFTTLYNNRNDDNHADDEDNAEGSHDNNETNTPRSTTTTVRIITTAKNTATIVQVKNAEVLSWSSSAMIPMQQVYMNQSQNSFVWSNGPPTIKQTFQWFLVTNVMAPNPLSTTWTVFVLPTRVILRRGAVDAQQGSSWKPQATRISRLGHWTQHDSTKESLKHT